MLFTQCKKSTLCIFLKSIANRKISLSAQLLRNKKKRGNYYEVLGLRQDCTQKDIKNAFIDLSKVHHPDSTTSSCDKEFKEILEAYQVLSKPHSRTNYDLSLRGIHTVSYVTKDTVHRPFESEGKRYSPFEDDNYYGVKGIKKVSNWKIVLACVLFCGAGVLAQVIAIYKSVTFRRDKLAEQTAFYNAQHKKIRSEVQESNLSNLERVMNRMNERAEK